MRLPIRHHLQPMFQAAQMIVETEELAGKAVCILGNTGRKNLFTQGGPPDAPLGQRIRLNGISCLVIGLLSIAPTIQFVRWSRQIRADPAFQPAAAELKRAQRWVGLELLLIFPLVALAAAMARSPF
jgi:hypothetical protein